MNNQENQNELLQVQKEIAELPAGYISKKIINGKTRYYLQWSEGGKKKSKYVDDALVDDLCAKIERRRELQKKEKELTFMLPKPQKTEKHEETKQKNGNGDCHSGNRPCHCCGRDHLAAGGIRPKRSVLWRSARVIA